jgi:C4-dicarboxylate-specific signal transduction histidine kinase
MHERYAEIVKQLEELDRLVDRLATTSDDVAILDLRQSSQLFRNTANIVAQLRETEMHAAVESEPLPALRSSLARQPGDTGKSEQHFLDELRRQAGAMVISARRQLVRHEQDFREAIQELAGTSMRNQRRVTVLLVGSLLLAAVVAQGFLGNHVLARLQLVSQSLRRSDIVDGHPVVPVHGDDEIAAMARAVEGFLDDRRQLALRTVQLEEANRDLAKTNEDLHRAMDHLLSTEKLASLGKLVAGVAHELNTPLGNMMLVATTLEDGISEFSSQARSGSLRRSDLDGFLTESLTAMSLLTRETHRAAELVGNFKQIAVDQSSLRRRRFDLATIVRETLSSLHNRLKKTAVTVEIDIPDGIVLDNFPGPIEQILTNFTVNSLVHAFDDGEKGVIRISAREKDGRLILNHEDNGRGMSEEVAKQIFDPFFTTKFGQGGSGLGLSIVYNLVTGVLEGTLHVATRPGAGTRFELSFPLDAPSVASAGEHDFES